jgi:site-specific DNA-cytosine methylase
LISNAATEWGNGIRLADQPAHNTTPQQNGCYRAWLDSGRWVRMTPRALARFQSVPDSYVLPERAALACRVIGNGVPVKLAQAITKSLID